MKICEQITLNISGEIFEDISRMTPGGVPKRFPEKIIKTEITNMIPEALTWGI